MGIVAHSSLYACCGDERLLWCESGILEVLCIFLLLTVRARFAQYQGEYSADAASAPGADFDCGRLLLFGLAT